MSAFYDVTYWAEINYRNGILLTFSTFILNSSLLKRQNYSCNTFIFSCISNLTLTMETNVTKTADKGHHYYGSKTTQFSWAGSDR